MKVVLGIGLSLMAIADLASWIKRGKIDSKAIWNSIADIIILIYTMI